jgi:hypothetical protein
MKNKRKKNKNKYSYLDIQPELREITVKFVITATALTYEAVRKPIIELSSTLGIERVKV